MLKYGYWSYPEPLAEARRLDAPEPMIRELSQLIAIGEKNPIETWLRKSDLSQQIKEAIRQGLTPARSHVVGAPLFDEQTILDISFRNGPQCSSETLSTYDRRQAGDRIETSLNSEFTSFDSDEYTLAAYARRIDAKTVFRIQWFGPFTCELGRHEAPGPLSEDECWNLVVTHFGDIAATSCPTSANSAFYPHIEDRVFGYEFPETTDDKLSSERMWSYWNYPDPGPLALSLIKSPETRTELETLLEVGDEDAIREWLETAKVSRLVTKIVEIGCHDTGRYEMIEVASLQWGDHLGTSTYCFAEYVDGQIVYTAQQDGWVVGTVTSDRELNGDQIRNLMVNGNINDGDYFGKTSFDASSEFHEIEDYDSGDYEEDG